MMEIKKVGLITSGGDAPGMNACLRFLIKGLIDRGITVYGIKRGYKGLVEKNYSILTKRDAGGIIQKGGTILGTARFPEFKNKEILEIAVRNLEELNIDLLFVIGGEGSMKGAYALHERGVKIIAIPASIDNDIYGTDESIGTDTALNAIVRSIDVIKDTASAHDRAFIIEVMGHTSGFLALYSSIAVGAEAVFIPEYDTDVDEVVRRLNQRFDEGRTNSIIVVAEGKASGYDIKQLMQEKGVKYELRVTVLGHLQRGGAPTFRDRKLSFDFATYAMELMGKGIHGVMVAKQKGNITHINLKDVITNKKHLEKRILKIVETLKWED